MYTQNSARKDLPKNHNHETEPRLLIFGYFSVAVQ